MMQDNKFAFLNFYQVGKLIKNDPKILPDLIDLISPRDYCNVRYCDPSLLEYTIESADVDMVKWLMNYMKEKYTKSNDKNFDAFIGPSHYESAIASRKIGMLQYVEFMSKMPLREYDQAFSIAGKYKSEVIIDYLIEQDIPQKQSAYINAVGDIDFLDFLFERNIIYDEQAMINVLHEHFHEDTLNWFHNKGFKCNANKAYLYSVYSGNIKSMKWLKDHGYVCKEISVNGKTSMRIILLVMYHCV